MVGGVSGVVAVKEKSDVKNEEKRGNAGGGKGGKGGKGTSSGSGAGTKIRTELTIMEKLLMPPAKVLATDATDSASGDRLLSKEQVPDQGRLVMFRVGSIASLAPPYTCIYKRDM